MKLDGLVKGPKRLFYGWWIVLGAALGMALNAGVYFYGFGAFFDSLIREFRSTRAVLSGAYSLARLESGILGPIDGLLVDKFGPRKIMLVGVLLMGAGFVLLSRVSSITEFYLVFVLMVALGGGLGFATPLITAVGNWFVRRPGDSLWSCLIRDRVGRAAGTSVKLANRPAWLEDGGTGGRHHHTCCWHPGCSSNEAQA